MSSDNQKTVLVVDDDEIVVETLCKVLKTNGLDTVSVSSGEEALLKLENQRYVLIIMDINMHGMDGFETIKVIRERSITTPIMIVSGRKEDFDTLYGLDIGADDYITKPFNPITLGAKAKAMIRRNQCRPGSMDTQISAGPFVYQTDTLRLYKNGVEIALTAKENAMMKLFIDNVNRIFAKDMI